MTVWPDTIVELEPWELLLAAMEAGGRWQRNTSAARRDRAGQGRSLDQEVAGVCGEIAVARWCGRYWTGGAKAAGDVGGLEVRCRRGAPQDEDLALPIQPYDEERRRDAPFVLVVGGAATYRVVGWTTPRRARAMMEEGTAAVADLGNVGRPAIFVPQQRLLPLDEFRVQPVAAEPVAA